MMSWRAFSLALVLCCVISQAQTTQALVPSTRRVPPVQLSVTHKGELSDRVETILHKQAKFLRTQLRPWDKDPAARLMTNGQSNEAGIRPNAHTAYGLAVLYRATGDRTARDDAIALLRFLLTTHSQPLCSDAKPWRSQWQSALWADSAGKAAWLLWEELEPSLRDLATQMICHEADRFVDLAPPTQIDRDTKAEENAWNSQVIALAFNMFPEHPRREMWRQTAIRWQVSAFATGADVRRADVVDGKPLSQWLTAPNLHDDYTLENHDRVHPDYSSTIRINLSQELVYGWGGNDPPAALRFNAVPIYSVLKTLTFPDGGFVYPNAQDWHLHRNADWFDVHAMMAVMFDDPQAARLARIGLETAEKMLSRSETGGIYAEGETVFPSSQSMLLELFADAFLVLRWKGQRPAPVDESRLWKDLSGVRVFDSGKFGIVRTDRSVATFSWGRQVMGMVLPLRKDLLLTPNDRGLIGIIGVEGSKKEVPRVKQVTVSSTMGGLRVSGLLDRCDGAVEQRFAFVALPDGRAVYADSLRALTDAKVTKLRLGLIGVLNDAAWVYHDGRRALASADSVAMLRADDASMSEFTSSSPWYNLDGLGIVCLRTSGRQHFQGRPTGARGRFEQLLSLNACDALPAGCVLVFYPAQDAARTREIASRCSIEATGREPKFFVRLDDGMVVPIDLDPPLHAPATR